MSFLKLVLQKILGWVFPERALSAKAPKEIVSDLDALVSESVAFKFQGKIHEIRPISTLELFKFVNAFSALQELNKKDDALTVSTLVDAYADVIGSVCPTIKREHIVKMTQSQLSALFQLVMDSVVGKTQVPQAVSSDSKKKQRK